MLAVLSVRLRQFTAQIENLSLKEVPGRLASYLIYLADEQGGEDSVTFTDIRKDEQPESNRSKGPEHQV